MDKYTIVVKIKLVDAGSFGLVTVTEIAKRAAEAMRDTLGKEPYRAASYPSVEVLQHTKE
jgi:hypothetical protein